MSYTEVPEPSSHRHQIYHNIIFDTSYAYLYNKTWITDKTQVSCKLLILFTWLGGNHSASLQVTTWRNLLNFLGACICNNWYPSDGRTVAHAVQSSDTTTPISREPLWSRSNFLITIFTEGQTVSKVSTNACTPASFNTLILVSLTRWRSDLVLITLMSFLIWTISWMGLYIFTWLRSRKIWMWWKGGILSCVWINLPSPHYS